MSSVKLAIFMAGYPFCGKSHVARLATEGFPECVIDPKKFRSDKYDTLTESEKREENLDVWEVSLDVLKECLEKDNPVVLYDTACASYLSMKPYFQLAKNYDRMVIYVWVDADLSVCKERASADWLPESVIDKYKKKFSISRPQLSEFSDGSLVIDNNDEPDISGLREIIGMAYE